MAKLKGVRRSTLQTESIDLSSELSPKYGGDVNQYKSVHHPLSTIPNREHPGSFENKSVSSSYK